MKTSEQFEVALGKRWLEMAKREGHAPAVPTNFDRSEKESAARADVILRHLKHKPNATMRTLASALKTTQDDVRTRMGHLIRHGKVRLIRHGNAEYTRNKNKYEVLE